MQYGNRVFGRGVWVAPWVGENGETVLIAMSRRRTLIGEPFVIPIGASHLDASDRMWALLDRDDPEPWLKVI